MRFCKKRILSALVMASMLLGGPGSVFAETGSDETASLKMELALLKERMASLESKLQATELKTAKIEADSTAIRPATVVPDAVTGFARDIEVHGFTDASYIFNTNTPVPPNSRTNNLRVFDTEANGFMFNNAQINIEKLISKASPIGFRVDLDYGQDAKLIHANGLGNSGDEFDLQQAYAQIMVPFSIPYMYALSFKIGKFVTLQGAEVIESVNNWNFSRSYLFGYAIPFTHTGVRAYYKPSESLPVEFYLGVANGWDNVTDNNKAKSIEAQMVVTANDKLSLTLGGMAGAERFDSDKDQRDLIDLVATYKATDKLTLKVNYDYGWERNGATYLPSSGTSPIATGLDDKNASWSGVAAYAKYDIKDWWSVAGRAEYFDDANGVRTGVLVNNGISHLDVFEFTLTNEFKIFKNIITRFEYRYDKASGQVFTKDKLTANYMNTLSMEAIYKF